MKNVKIFFLALVLILFTGCVTKEETNMLYNQKVSDIMSADANVSQIKDSIIEKKISQQYISTRNKKVSEALAEAGSMESRNYMLVGDDMEMPYTHNFKGIYNFQTLKDYIEDTTEKTLKITKNKLTKNRVKTVVLENKNSADNYFKNINFTLSANDVDIRTALNQFSTLTGYSVIYEDRIKQDTSTEGAKKIAHTFSSPFLSYSGVNAQQFLDFLKSSIDVYLYIDHKSKMIKISKYKLKEIPLMITNRTISKEGTNAIETGSANSSGSTEGSLESKIDLKAYETFKKSIDELVLKINDKTGDTNYVSVGENTGIVSLYATRSAMDVLEEKVKFFNKSYSSQGTLTITTIELVVKNSHKIGSDLTGVLFSKGDVSLGVDTAVSDALSSTINIVNKGKYTDLTTVVESLKDIGHIAKKTTYYTLIRNHTPSLLRDLEKTNYVKNSTANVTNTDSTTTIATTTETEELQTGSIGVVLPKIYGDQVSLYVSIDDVTNEGITKERFGETEINIPTIKPRTFDNEYLLRSGEHKIILNTTRYEDSNNYKGWLPMEDYIIGGFKNKSYVRKELIHIVSVDIDGN